jgi:hypothetical protein
MEEREKTASLMQPWVSVLAKCMERAELAPAFFTNPPRQKKRPQKSFAGVTI